MNNKIIIGTVSFVIGFGFFASLMFFFTSQEIKNAQEGTKVIVEIEYRGGLCAPTGDETQGSMCVSEERIRSSGFYSGGKNLTEEQLETLVRLIEESNLGSVQYDENPSCASFVDGQDVSYIYPTRYGETRFTLCLIDNPTSFELLRFTSEVLESRER